MNNIEARLQNTEKALMALVTVLIDLQPPETQDSLDYLLSQYFEANDSLGFDTNSFDFLTCENVESES